MKHTLAIITTLVFFLQGCKKDDPQPVNTTDKIEITNVTPTTGLKDGDVVNFTVDVSYNLAKSSTGTLMIGFNNGTASTAMIMLANINKVVNKGSGTHTFAATATVKNWGTQADFRVYVNLSQDPLPGPGVGWTPYAIHTVILIPKQ